MTNQSTNQKPAILAAIEVSSNPDESAFIRILMPDAIGVRVLPVRLIILLDEALALVKAVYPTAQIVEPHELSKEVMRRQPVVPAQEYTIDTSPEF